MLTPRNQQTSDILIVDDDDDDRDIFCEIVNEINSLIRCLTYNRAEHALKELRSSECPMPRLIFLDLNMPGMNGIQCLIELKADPVFKSIPVIIYSTGCIPKDVNLALEQGATNYIVKPSCYRKTVNAIRFFLVSYNLLAAEN